MIIDPLGRMSLTPLFDVLKDRELILHGADYDLRMLWKGCRFRPRSMFDTMWAARLLGYSEFGLTQLAGQVLGITLEKGSQKTNWARRPLTERMEQYARNDTRYLRPLAEALSRELEKLDRAAWQAEVCARVIEECSQDRIQDPDLVWRVKEATPGSTSAGGLARALALAGARSQEEKQAPIFHLQPRKAGRAGRRGFAG